MDGEWRPQEGYSAESEWSKFEPELDEFSRNKNGELKNLRKDNKIDLARFPLQTLVPLLRMVILVIQS